jgi:predicted DNA-binding protein with PD1-like motif
MKTVTFFLFLLLGSGLKAQEKVPELKIITTDFTSVVIIKMNPGTDMLEGLNQAVKEKNIRNGVIISGVGSVTDYSIHVVSDKNLPPAQEYPKASVPMDVVSVQGYILDGRVHAHIALSDENSVIGGHLEKGTKALTFFIITIGILPDNLKIGDLDTYK